MNCKVRALTLHIRDNQYLYIDNLPLVSRHLRTLDLHGVALQKSFLDFASCPELEDMRMDTCLISVNKISSRSLKHLSITGCRSDLDCRIHVSTPGLVSLELDASDGLTPFLENMALLETAFVYLDDDCEDVCLNYVSGVFCGANNDTCKNCVPIGTNCSSNCVLLGGISSAKHLKLISETGKVCQLSLTPLCYPFLFALSTSLLKIGILTTYALSATGVVVVLQLDLNLALSVRLLACLFLKLMFQFIFSRDLKHCPTFTKLKTLLLNDYWCEAPDMDPLSCILKNSPVLEKLTLELFPKGQTPKVQMKGSYCCMQRPSAISEHLKIVEVKCDVVNKRIAKVLKFLCAFSAFDIRFSFE
uniref:Uncharacterized protein n=2 Tax=Aegilops tauschii subsp. strangulata TaxID=200361 RepID=A0A453N1L1_AEGTS